MNLTIDIQKTTATYDSYGQPVESWSNLYTGLFASAITTGGKEFYAAQRQNAETAMVFKTRYITGITTLMRVKYGSRYFNILSVNNKDEKFEYLLLSCKEVT